MPYTASTKCCGIFNYNKVDGYPSELQPLASTIHIYPIKFSLYRALG